MSILMIARFRVTTSVASPCRCLMVTLTSLPGSPRSSWIGRIDFLLVRELADRLAFDLDDPVAGLDACLGGRGCRERRHHFDVPLLVVEVDVNADAAELRIPPTR